ncbi:MAG: SRPBCC domain-containing protein [Acidiferrobacterales bacterium]
MNQGDTRLVMKRAFQAPVEKVYQAWTTPELIQQWFAPGDMIVPKAQADVREGGLFRITMQEPNGETHTTYGTYREVVPHQRLVLTWQWEGADDETLVTIEFHAVGERTTELVLTHEGFATVQAKEAHSQGWNGCLQKLDGTLAAES